VPPLHNGFGVALAVTPVGATFIVITLVADTPLIVYDMIAVPAVAPAVTVAVVAAPTMEASPLTVQAPPADASDTVNVALAHAVFAPEIGDTATAETVTTVVTLQPPAV
jgi:hypothetical protein